MQNIPKITKKWLEEKKACQSGIDYVKSTGLTDCVALLERGLQDKRYSDCIWLLKRVLNRKQLIQWAVYSAELVAHINPDPRVQTAIDAAKVVIENDTEENRTAADAAARATYAVAYAAYAALAADAAWSAARASADATAYNAADATTYATAYAAAYAAFAADAAWSAAGAAAYQKTINYAIGLFKCNP